MDLHEPHYHLRWYGKALNWERFNTHGEAEASAKQLVCLGETYGIEELDGNCPRCHDFFSRWAD